MQKRLSLLLLFSVLTLLFLPLVLAHDHGKGPYIEIQDRHATDIQQYYPINTFTALAIGLFSMLIFIVIIVCYKDNMPEPMKKFLFVTISLIIVAVTVYFIGTTLYINHISQTKGPIHWHADFEFWKCGEKIDMLDPSGLSNKVGTPIFHEHNDDRIHIEGVVIDYQDISLSSFFGVIGGELTQNHFSIPTNDGKIEASNAETCNGNPGKVQVFVYRVENPKDHKNWVATQQKLDQYESFVLAPYVDVPAGDCIIVEFDQEKESTDKMCSTYQIAIEKGEMRVR